MTESLPVDKTANHGESDKFRAALGELPESAVSESSSHRTEARSSDGQADPPPHLSKQQPAKARAAEGKQAQPPSKPKSPRPPIRKPENVSGLSLDDALAVTVPTDLDASARYVRDIRAVIVATDKKSFRLARRIGEVVKAHKEAAPHANTKGVAQSWEDRCKVTFGFTARCGSNYMALLAIPEDTDITLRDAYIQAGVYKVGGTDEAATDSNYKEQLLAKLTPVQRTIEVNGKLPQEFDDDDLAQIVHTMTGIPLNKLPKKTCSPTPKETKQLPEQGGGVEGDDEQARMDLAKERVDVVKRLVKRFVDVGNELVTETEKMKKEIKDGTYTGANYSSAKEGAAFKDAIAQIRGGVRRVHDGIGNLYDISEACAHDDIKEIGEARKAFYAFPMISPPATSAAEES